MKSITTFTLTLGFLLLLVSPAMARTWYILPDGAGDAPTIQAGIDSATTGDTVLLACGHYFEHDIDLKSGITLRGETGSWDCVTIDAQQAGRVLRFSPVTITAPTVVAGLTLTNGHHVHGGGIVVTRVDLTIENCRFVNYSAESGGAFYAQGSDDVHLIDCVFDDNSADGGGAVYLTTAGDTRFSGCLFAGNSASFGSAVGDDLNLGLQEFDHCTFYANEAPPFTGGSSGWALEAGCSARHRSLP